MLSRLRELVCVWQAALDCFVLIVVVAATLYRSCEMNSWVSHEAGEADCSAINEYGNRPDTDTSIKNHHSKGHFAMWRIRGEGHYSEDVVLQNDFAMTTHAACSIAAAKFDCRVNVKGVPPIGWMQLILGVGKLCGL